MESVKETNVLFQDPSIFGDTLEHSYSVTCYNGYAIAEKEEEDDTCPSVVYLTYPKREDIDDVFACMILKYRGLNDLTPSDLTYGDIMMKCGTITLDSPSEDMVYITIEKTYRASVPCEVSKIKNLTEKEKNELRIHLTSLIPNQPLSEAIIAKIERYALDNDIADSGEYTMDDSCVRSIRDNHCNYLYHD